jgi:2-polyprenyl-3-methyl-5-hydroxy-6-metoxy-1,4-benzoquinol methylase
MSELVESTEGQPTRDAGALDSDRHEVFEENITRKIERKHELLRPHISGSVLHIGAVGAGPDSGGMWFHGFLRERAEDIVGIDIDPRIDGMADGVRGDAQDFDLGREFDTIVATNLIEHVANPGSVLACAREHLAEDGVILMTTPRTHIPWNVLRELHGGMDAHPEHKMWYCRSTMKSLAESRGLEIVEHQTWGFARLGTTPADKAWRAVERVLSRVPPLSSIDEYQHFFVLGR